MNIKEQYKQTITSYLEVIKDVLDCKDTRLTAPNRDVLADILKRRNMIIEGIETDVPSYTKRARELTAAIENSSSMVDTKARLLRTLKTVIGPVPSPAMIWPDKKDVLFSLRGVIGFVDKWSDTARYENIVIDVEFESTDIISVYGEKVSVYNTEALEKILLGCTAAKTYKSLSVNDTIWLTTPPYVCYSRRWISQHYGITTTVPREVDNKIIKEILS